MTMTKVAIAQITRELQLTQRQVQATVELLDSGATVPFIARYRKEATGSLDEVAISDIRDRLSQLKELSTRREAVLTSLEERDLLTEELREAVLSADTMAALEDVYQFDLSIAVQVVDVALIGVRQHAETDRIQCLRVFDSVQVIDLENALDT